jgi:DNA topoisomerase-3
MTAINERMLLEIEQGKRDVDSFVKMQEKFVRDRLRLLTLELSKLPVVCKFLSSTNARYAVKGLFAVRPKSRSLLVLRRLSHMGVLRILK